MSKIDSAVWRSGLTNRPPWRSVRSGDWLLDRVDGLLLVGGADIEPGRPAVVRHRADGGVRPDRDAGELTVLSTALAGRSCRSDTAT